MAHHSYGASLPSVHITCLKGETIDQLIITHPHEDHIWGIPDMYKYNMTPKVLKRPKNAFPIKTITPIDKPLKMALITSISMNLS